MKKFIFYLVIAFLILAKTVCAKQPSIKDIDFDLNPDKTVEDEEIIRLYNFYWLSVLRSYKYSLRNIEANR